MKIWNQMKTQVNSNNSGFTFLEILVSITILSFGILGLLSTVHSVSTNQRNADDITEATMVAADQMERLKRLATNEPLGGIYGFSYFVNDQAGGFLNSYTAPNNFFRIRTETVGNFTRTTQVMVFPPPAWATESFTNPDSIHMVEVEVDVSWVNSGGSTKNVTLNTVLQRRQFIQ